MPKLNPLAEIQNVAHPPARNEGTRPQQTNLSHPAPHHGHDSRADRQPCNPPTVPNRQQSSGRAHATATPFQRQASPPSPHRSPYRYRSRPRPLAPTSICRSTRARLKTPPPPLQLAQLTRPPLPSHPRKWQEQRRCCRSCCCC
jgi:hypothetical protein